MKLAHLSDLHLGKRLHGLSLLEDQDYILREILAILDDEQPAAVLLSGDIYDRSVPSSEAVSLFDDFLVALAARGFPVLLISGNHDSAERLAFGGRLMAERGVHFSPLYDGTLQSVQLEDEHGAVQLHLLPFLKPAQVRRFYPEAAIESYSDALRCALAQTPRNAAARQVLLAHQFVTGAARSDSEEHSVGGLDNVDAAVFAGFDYVALGHLHRAQNIGSERLRYCGSPLKYSFSEAVHEKSLTFVDLGAAGSVAIHTRALKPLRDLRVLKGPYAALCDRRNYAGSNTEDYLQVTLTDEEEIPDAAAKMRTIYPNLLRLDYDNRRTRGSLDLQLPANLAETSPLTLFTDFYELQNNNPPSQAQVAYLENIIESIWEGTQ